VANEKSPIESTQSMHRPKLSDMEIITGQRNSLPDITTTPKDENGQFYASGHHQVRTSHSIENILHTDHDDDVDSIAPPPKPSRLLSVPTPPSIPPKKPRDSVDNSNVFAFSTRNMSLERSKSPDMNSSIGSMGSMLNNLSIDNDFHQFDNDDVKHDFSSNCNVKVVENKFSSSSSSVEQHRTSNESGFVSITSQSNIFKQQQQQQQQQMIVEHSSIMNNSQSHENVQKISNLDHHQQQQSIIISSPLQERDFKYTFDTEEVLSPPPLPIKTKSKKYESQRSLYDNVEASENNSLLTIVTTSSSNSSLTSSSTITSFSNAFSHDNNFEMHSKSVKNKYFSCIEPRELMQDPLLLGNVGSGDDDKPPLPPKKNKHSKLISYF
jgi:hypothetical protein